MRVAVRLSLILPTLVFACTAFSADEPGAATPGGGDADAASDGSGDGPVVNADPDEALEIVEVPVPAIVTQGTRSPLKVKLRRGAGVLGELKIQVRDLPDKIVSLEGSTSGVEGTVTLDAAAAAKQGAFDVTVEVTVVSTRRKVSRPLKVLVRGPAGMVDTTFGTDGAMAVPFAAGDAARGFDMFLQNDDSIVLVASCTQNASEVPCFARLAPNGSLDSKFDTAKGSPYVYGQHPGTPRTTAYLPFLDMQIVGGSTSGKGAIGNLTLKQTSSSVVAFPVAPGAATNGAVWGLAVRPTDNHLIAAFETGGTQFALGHFDFGGTPIVTFGTMGYSPGLSSERLRALRQPQESSTRGSSSFWALGRPEAVRPSESSRWIRSRDQSSARLPYRWLVRTARDMGLAT